MVDYLFQNIHELTFKRADAVNKVIRIGNVGGGIMIPRGYDSVGLLIL